MVFVSAVAPDQGRERLRKFRLVCFVCAAFSLIAAAVTAFVVLKGKDQGTNPMALSKGSDNEKNADNAGEEEEIPLPMIGQSNDVPLDFSGEGTNEAEGEGGEPEGEAGGSTKQYEVLDMVGHDKTSFTQGLSYGSDGFLYETTGLNGKSKIRRINPTTFEVELSRDISSQYFGEGSTFYTDKDGNDRIIHITWKSQTGFIYDPTTLEQLSLFTYTTTTPKNQGWGITYDDNNQEFIVSDGSQYLYFWDRDTLAEKRRITVTRSDGTEQDELNELEMIDGLVCCNIWYSDEIICVNPQTGISEKEIDFSDLWSKEERESAGADVLNGIANGGDHILLTGKLWDRMYKIKLLV
mmetsp:Transcript_21282/g.45158  ORF Transcript_21282/g.45158 Transcript_21282/m.45158 type:complete len:352 (-) Transcript_21282:61-1116(-)